MISILKIFKITDTDLKIIILKLKKRWLNYLLWSLPFLIIIAIIYYYSIESHPKFLNLFWNKFGLSSNRWTYFWLTLGIIFLRRKLTHSKPSEESIRWYIDCLDENELEKISLSFKRYEKYFFSKNKDASEVYATLLEKNEFWYMISKNHKEWLSKNHKRLLFKDNLKVLLSSQLSKLPDSPIAKELEKQKDDELSDYTPILNIFLSTATFIEEAQKRSVFFYTIKVEANEYFSSNKFLKDEKESFILKPSDNVSKQVAPKRLIIFYYIQLIDSYWHQVIQTKGNGFAWPAYEYWTKELLAQAPVAVDDFVSDDLPNLYLVAVDKMFSNISNWVSKIKESSKQEYIQDFIDLKIAMLLEIQKNHLDKVSKAWLINKTDSLLDEVITGKKSLQNTYEDRNIKKKLLKLKYLKPAFKKLKESDYYGSEMIMLIING